MARTRKKIIRFVCQNCSHQSIRWHGRCPECEAWNTLVEEQIDDAYKHRGVAEIAEHSNPIPLREISQDDVARILCKSTEFNRVLGGGIVPGSLILFGGDPGIGKSTLLLQEGVALAGDRFKVIYVTGEESVRQTKMRAQRLALDSDHLLVLAETDLNKILAAIARIKPNLVIVDSIQTIYRPDLESPPGSVSQVRECALALLKFAKSKDTAVFLVGHVTKEGYLAGPKVLEHMVDTLLQFEGDRNHLYRIIRSVKNRFGSTREIGVFEMHQGGLREINNPSKIFLSQRKKDISGSVVVCTIEGTRPLLVEMQALLTPSNYGTPQRTANGIDGKRLALLLAVLEKRIGIRVGTQDVFVNVAGGVQLDEPAADLGILVAAASSTKNIVIDPDVVVFGEVGLGGEVRTVPQIERRLSEAAKLGFKHAVIPDNTAEIEEQIPQEISVTRVQKVEDALDRLL